MDKIYFSLILPDTPWWWVLACMAPHHTASGAPPWIYLIGEPEDGAPPPYTRPTGDGHLKLGGADSKLKSPRFVAAM